MSLTGGNPVVYRFVIGGCKICRLLGDAHIPWTPRFINLRDNKCLSNFDMQCLFVLVLIS